ncbi:MAG: MlaD family protein [Spirochaetia bacterium]|jgi:phospholipid/cholesterol/gamma-HCH transport system substrate-binding protein|nr:MlaD family protein [Spirochaetia bacterium]
MKFKIKYADQVVGLFVILAIISVSVLLIFMGVNQRWFSRNYYYHTRFLSADGLKIGMAIRLKGFQIGQIDKISLSSKNEVEADFYIYSEYIDKILPNTIIQKITNPVGIGSDLLIHPGKGSGDPLPEFSFIPSYNLPEARELIASGEVDIPQGDSTVTRIINQIDPLIFKVNLLLDTITELSATANKTIKGEDKGPAGKIVKNVEGITAELNKILAETSKQIADLMVNIKNMSGNFSQMSDHLADPTGIIPKLMGPEGSAAAIFSDDRQLFYQLTSILENLDKTMLELNAFTSYLNQSTPQLTGILEESRGALKEGTAVLEGLKNNPLLRKGITGQRQQADTLQSTREEDF